MCILSHSILFLFRLQHGFFIIVAAAAAVAGGGVVVSGDAAICHYVYHHFFSSYHPIITTEEKNPIALYVCVAYTYIPIHCVHIIHFHLFYFCIMLMLLLYINFLCSHLKTITSIPGRNRNCLCDILMSI